MEVGFYVNIPAIVPMTNGVMESSQPDNPTLGTRLFAVLVITIAVWISIELVGIVTGHSPRGGPLLLAEFPVLPAPVHGIFVSSRLRSHC